MSVASKGLRMNRMTIPVLLLGMIAASPLAVSADATFDSAVADLDSAGTLSVTFVESGLVTTPETVTLTADGTATYTCPANPTAKDSKKDKTVRVTEHLTVSGAYTVTFDAAGVGTAQGAISVGAAPIRKNFTCPGTEESAAVLSVTYANIAVTGSAGNTSPARPSAIGL
jgi:hypothetical protein